jgi:hypothetical protein
VGGGDVEVVGEDETAAFAREAALDLVLLAGRDNGGKGGAANAEMAGAGAFACFCAGTVLFVGGGGIEVVESGDDDNDNDDERAEMGAFPRAGFDLVLVAGGGGGGIAGAVDAEPVEVRAGVAVIGFLVRNSDAEGVGAAACDGIVALPLPLERGGVGGGGVRSPSSSFSAPSASASASGSTSASTLSSYSPSSSGGSDDCLGLTGTPPSSS